MKSDPNCIFCKIVAGEIPCHKVYESDTVLSFLDIAPVRKGHLLVIPKEHFEDILVTPEALGADFMTALKRLGEALMQGLGAAGFNIGVNTKKPAGQMVFHVHWHIIPRAEGDGLTLWGQGAYDNAEEAAKTAQTIQGYIT
jgi:histidine triad (HIT) family protein